MSDPRVVRIIHITEFTDHTFSVHDDRGPGRELGVKLNIGRDEVYDFVSDSLYADDDAG